MKSYTISDILSALDGWNISYEFTGDCRCKISGFSDPAAYREGEAIWLGSTKYLHLYAGLSYKKIRLLFCRPDMEGAEQFPNRILCKNPRDTFLAIASEFAVEKQAVFEISPTAILSPKSVIGENVSIGPFCVIEDDVEIGDNTSIGSGTIIHNGVRIGKDCVIFDHVVMGNPSFGFYETPDGEYRRFPHLGKLIVGDRVEIGSLSSLDRGTFKDTIIGDDTKIDTSSGVGHNTEIGRNCRIISSQIGGNCYVGDNVEIIATRSKNRVTIGSDSKIGVGSVVISDVPEGVTCFGNPARIIKRD